jgi:hypothetical protein
VELFPYWLWNYCRTRIFFCQRFWPCISRLRILATDQHSVEVITFNFSQFILFPFIAQGQRPASCCIISHGRIFLVSIHIQNNISLAPGFM